MLINGKNTKAPFLNLTENIARTFVSLTIDDYYTGYGGKLKTY